MEFLSYQIWWITFAPERLLSVGKMEENAGGRTFVQRTFVQGRHNISACQCLLSLFSTFPVFHNLWHFWPYKVCRAFFMGPSSLAGKLLWVVNQVEWKPSIITKTKISLFFYSDFCFLKTSLGQIPLGPMPYYRIAPVACSNWTNTCRTLARFFR